MESDVVTAKCSSCNILPEIDRADFGKGYLLECPLCKDRVIISPCSLLGEVIIKWNKKQRQLA